MAVLPPTHILHTTTFRFLSRSSHYAIATLHDNPQPTRPWRLSNLHNFNRSCRPLHTSQWPPIVFMELLFAVWAYKCLIMIVFQNKLIYLPYIPYGARRETIQDYTPQLLGYDWTTSEVMTRDGKRLSTCVAEIRKNQDAPDVIVIYFQGFNLNSLSLLIQQQRVIDAFKTAFSFAYSAVYDANCTAATCESLHCGAILSRVKNTPSLRLMTSYWTSTGRPSQAGLEKDALAVLEWIGQCRPNREVSVILYGHSIGAGVACFAAASNRIRNLKIKGIILETPFTSVSDMLRALYPQKWLPYHYLGPFLRSSWNIKEYLSRISNKEKPRIMIVQAENDEVVEKWMAPEIKAFAVQKGYEVDHFNVPGALHFECMGYRAFPGWVSSFIAKCVVG